MVQHSKAQHGMAQHSITQHSMAQIGTAWHRTAQHGTAQHGIAQHGTAQHGTPSPSVQRLTWHPYPCRPLCHCRTIKLIVIMLQCVGTWLNGMVDPTVIADGLESLDTYLSGTSSTSGVFDPAREAVITDLASYGVCTRCFCKLDCLCCFELNAYKHVCRSKCHLQLVMLHYSCILFH